MDIISKGYKSFTHIDIDALSDDYDIIDIQDTYGEITQIPRGNAIWDERARKFECWRGDLVVPNMGNTDAQKSFKHLPRGVTTFFRVKGTYYRISGSRGKNDEPIIMCAVHLAKLEFIFSPISTEFLGEALGAIYEVFDEEFVKVDLLDLLMRYQQLGEYIRHHFVHNE